MSTKKADSQLLNKLLDKCADKVISVTQGQQDHVQLGPFSLEGFERIRDRFIEELERRVNPHGKGAKGIRVVEASAVASGQGLKNGLYFVRYVRHADSGESQDEKYEVLFELNPYRRVLNVGVPIREEVLA